MKLPSDPSSAPLNAILREWRMDAMSPPRFQEDVWRRIESGERHAAAPQLWRALENYLATLFARPAWAAAYLAVLLAGGSLAGHWQAQAKGGRDVEVARQAYLQSVDPYQAPRH
jgi:hypothetical protein